MRKLYAFAALALIASPALAAETYSFEIGGRRIHIDVPDNCDDMSCVAIRLPGARDDRSRPSHPLQPSTSAPSARPPAGSAATPPAAPPPAPSGATAAPPPPASTAAAPPASSPPPAANAPAVVASAPPAGQVPSAPAPVAAASPIGVWVTEKNEGRVRIEPCAQNLCGYALQGNANSKQ